ncbi:MAG: RDD family protein [Gammaproteobacteria bacterium]
MSNLEQSGSLPTAREAPGLHGGFWCRVAAYIIDAIAVDVLFYLLMLVVWVILWLSGHATGHLFESVLGAAFIGFWWLGSIILIWLYFVLFESSRLQATPGKMALGLIVTDEHGRRIGFGRATGRYFAKMLSSLIFCIGYMMAGWTARKQALHDLIAATCVVRKRSLETLDSTVRSEAAASSGTIPGWAIALIVGGILFVGLCIMAILAAIAIPLYLNYTDRAQVTEAISIAQETRTDLLGYRAKAKAWPAPVVIASLNNYAATHAPLGKYTRGLRVVNCEGEHCGIVATMRNTGLDNRLAGKTLELWTTDGGYSWHCGPGGDSPLEVQSLPPSCRDSGVDASDQP